MERVKPGIYRQAAQIRRLISAGEDGRLIHCAEPFLRALHQATEETVNLGILRQGRVVYLTVLESPQPLRRIVNPNMNDPFTCTALGRAIVAQLSVERREFLVRNTVLERRTPHTVVHPSKLLTILEEVRKARYAVEENETDLGVICIGAPVFEPSGVAGAISLTVPTVRDNRERRRRFVAAVQQTAEKITQALEKCP
jgi:DNA-binding IclR family transcriptional regulator